MSGFAAPEERTGSEEDIATLGGKGCLLSIVKEKKVFVCCDSGGGRLKVLRQCIQITEGFTEPRSTFPRGRIGAFKLNLKIYICSSFYEIANAMESL